MVMEVVVIVAGKEKLSRLETGSTGQSWLELFVAPAKYRY